MKSEPTTKTVPAVPQFKDRSLAEAFAALMTAPTTANRREVSLAALGNEFPWLMEEGVA